MAGLNSQVIRFAEGDAREAAAVLHTQAITGSAATPDAILRGLPGADWIHLSTHGTLVQTNPYLSYLELSGGTVSAWQVFTAVNQAEFLILTALPMSAEDAGGALSMGGLAARAGVRRVLASAWKVVDDSSAQLMQAFYTEMAKDPAHPAESLQRAKASLVDKPYGPYELANFMLSVEDPAALSFAGRIGRR